MFEIIATHSESGIPQGLRINHSDLATKEEADAITALFPKSLLARTTRCSHVGKTGEPWPADTFYTTFSVKLAPTKGNDKNEGGIKRYRAFRKVAAKHGIPVKFYSGNPKWYYTEEELEAAIS